MGSDAFDSERYDGVHNWKLDDTLGIATVMRVVA